MSDEAFDKIAAGLRDAIRLAASSSQEEGRVMIERARELLQKHAQSPLDRVIHVGVDEAVDAILEALSNPVSGDEPTEADVAALRRVQNWLHVGDAGCPDAGPFPFEEMRRVLNIARRAMQEARQKGEG